MLKIHLRLESRIPIEKTLETITVIVCDKCLGKTVVVSRTNCMAMALYWNNGLKASEILINV